MNPKGFRTEDFAMQLGITLPQARQILNLLVFAEMATKQVEGWGLKMQREFTLEDLRFLAEKYKERK